MRSSPSSTWPGAGLRALLDVDVSFATTPPTWQTTVEQLLAGLQGLKVDLARALAVAAELRGALSPRVESSPTALLRRHDESHQTVRQLGGTLGVAVIGSVILAHEHPLGAPAGRIADTAHAMTYGFWIAVGIFALGLVIGWALLPRRTSAVESGS